VNKIQAALSQGDWKNKPHVFTNEYESEPQWGMLTGLEDTELFPARQSEFPLVGGISTYRLE